jgi:hypothetical protein
MEMDGATRLLSEGSRVNAILPKPLPLPLELLAGEIACFA